MGWKLYIAEPTIFARRSLRRYAGIECPATRMKIHDEEVVVDDQLVTTDEELVSILDDDHGGDPRWPAACVCGYKFHPEDHRQVNVNRLYSGAADGRLYILRELPPGGCWDAHWMEHARYKGPDGKSWACMMPCMVEWMVYGPSSDDTLWTVTGTIPNITVHPSIAVGGLYHGYIKGGEISEDVEGRKFEHLKRT